MAKLSMLKAFAAFLGALAAVACSQTETNTGAEESFPTVSIGEKTLAIELAITRSEQTKGLMYRDGIEDDYGMLFVYDSPQRMSYWMKNVDFDIDIGFFTADGILREVYPLYAQDTKSRKSIRDDLKYALETRRGWFRDNGIRPGAKLDVEAVNAAIAERRAKR